MTDLLPISLAIACVVLTGCGTVQQASAPADVVALPDAFSLYPEGDATAARWWTAFAADELNGLVDEALSNGLSVAEARVRLEQAELRVKQAGAALIPALTLEAGAGSRRSKQDTGIDADRTVTTDSYSLGLAASYELDLWGRVRSERRAILHDAVAGRYDLAAAEISLAAMVSQTWIDLVAARMTHALLREQLEANRRILELLDMRFRRAMVSAVDLARQQQSVAAIEAALPITAATERTLSHALALLLGRVPSAAPLSQDTALPPLPAAAPSVGLPADVLAQRPDIRRAGAQFQAAAERVEAARAARLPALRLSASAAYASSATSSLFDNWLANLAANLTGPLFDAGLRRSEVARIDAVRRQSLIAYKQAVLNAVREVEDALVRETLQREHIAARERQLAAARSALSEQEARYTQGQDTYLRVLDQQIVVWTLEREMINAQAALLKYRVALHRSIAGAFNEEE